MNVTARIFVTGFRRAAAVWLLLAGCHEAEPVLAPSPSGRFEHYAKTCGDIPRVRGGIRQP